MIGWICPKCKRGVNPNTSHCNCDNEQYTPFNPFTPKPFNPITEIKKVINPDVVTTIGTTVDRPYTIIY